MRPANSAQINRRMALRAGAGLIATAVSAPRSSGYSSGASMRFEPYSRLDGLGMAELVRKGEVSATELLDQAIQRAETVNPKINAIIEILHDRARDSIRRGLPEGPFTGVPFAVKDISFAVEGVLSEHGSKLFSKARSRHDSTAIARYRKAGLVLFARTATPELGLLPTTESSFSGITRNPWNLERTAGGSSGGAAAAVAAGVTPVASGSDGGGSIRIPASCCGLFGLKPTRARVPLGPDNFEGWGGLSTVHSLTRSVRDSAALLDVASGPELGDAYACPPNPRPFLEEVSQAPGALRIAVVLTMPPAKDPHNECRKAVDGAAKLCTKLGHKLTDATAEFGQQFPFEKLREAMGVAALVGTRMRVLKRLSELSRELLEDDLEPVTRYYYDLANEFTAVQMVQARSLFHRASRIMASFQRNYDVVMTPTLATPPIEHGRISLMGLARDVQQGILDFMPCTQLANWTGQPAMSVPLHWSEDGLPVGVQFFGRFADEATLLRLAGQLEREQPWFDRRPPEG